jgi:RHS repeat-associated protein
VPVGRARQTTFAYSYDGSGNITQTIVTDAKGNQTAYDYMQGVPISITKGYGSSVAATWSYVYDPASGGVAFTTDPDGHTSTIGYDQYGNAASVTDGLGRTTTSTFDNLYDLLTVTDPKGVTTTNTYDSDGNLQASSTPLLNTSGSPVLNGSNPVVSTVTYNHTDGHPEDVTSKVDADGNTWTYTYDGLTGYVTSASAPSTTDNIEHPGVAQSNETLYGYDSIKGWRTAELAPRGQQATRTAPSLTYSCTPPALGRTTFAYSPFGQVLTTTDPNGHVTANGYDADQNLVSATDAAGNITGTTFDAAEEPVATTQADGTVTGTAFNLDGTVADTVDAFGNKTLYGYDTQGRLISVTDPDARTTTYGYDPIGNLVSKADPGGSCPTWPISYPPTLSPSQLCTVYEFDAANEQLGVFYSDGATPDVTAVSYDPDGQRISQTEAWPGVGTKTSTWAWDSLHRLAAVTDDNSLTVTYGYAAASLPQGQELLYGPTSIAYPGSGGGTLTRVFDAEGRLDSLTDWKSNTTTFDFTADDTPATTTDPAGTHVVDTTYDNADQISSIVTDKNTTTLDSFTYTRTAANDVASVTSTGVPSDNQTYTYDPLLRIAAEKTTLYGYDGANNPTTTLASATQYFDPANQLTASVAGPGIDLVGTATAANSTGTTLAVTYPAAVKSTDQLLLAVTLAYPNTLTVPSGWTQVSKTSSGTVSGTSDTTYVLRRAAGSTTSVTITFSGSYTRAAVLGDYRGVASSPVDVTATATTAGGTTVATPSVTTTAAGDRLVVIDGAYTTTPGTWTPPSGSTARNQGGTTTPTVVALNDQPQQTAGATGTLSATYSQSSQLVGIIVALKPATTQPTAATYTYNARGDRTGVTPPTGSASTLGYDQANRLTTFTEGTTSASYTYSGDGLLMSKTVRSTTDTFTWDTTSTVPAILTDQNLDYIYGPDGLPVEQISASGTVSWYHHDQLGTTRLLTSTTGAKVGTFTYDPYGNQTGITGTVTSPLGYAGSYTDAESGLIYLTNRYYDAATGQYLTRDPLDALTQSAYDYVGDDPLNGTDPAGLWGWNPLKDGGEVWHDTLAHCGLSVKY